MTPQLEIRPFFDPITKTVTYLVWDTATGEGAVIDPVLDFDPASGEVDNPVRRTGAGGRQRHSASGYDLVARDPRPRRPPERGAVHRRPDGRQDRHRRAHREVQEIFAPVFDAADVTPDGSEFDTAVRGRRAVPARRLEVEVLHTPGHTPADVSYRIGDAVFVGDTLFMPDYGTARADFPGGDARAALSLDPQAAEPARRRHGCSCATTTRRPGATLCLGDDGRGGRRERNVHIHDGVTEDEFVADAAERATPRLAPPALLLPSIQVNIRAGRFPPAEANGARYIRCR